MLVVQPQTLVLTEITQYLVPLPQQAVDTEANTETLLELMEVLVGLEEVAVAAKAAQQQVAREPQTKDTVAEMLGQYLMRAPVGVAQVKWDRPLLFLIPEEMVETG